jgi:CBS domain-containing protein
MKTTVQEIMTTRVIWVSKDATFREMAAALRQHRVSAFPVVDDRAYSDDYPIVAGPVF